MSTISQIKPEQSGLDVISISSASASKLKLSLSSSKWQRNISLNDKRMLALLIPATVESKINRHTVHDVTSIVGW